MPFNRTQIVFCLLALSACAHTDTPHPAAAPDIALRPDTTPPVERRKANVAKTGAASMAKRNTDTIIGGNPENSVYFSSGEIKVDERGQELLRRHAAHLKDNPQQVVTLIGYSDSVGSPSYNLALTEERMDAVAEILRSLGVARGQIRRVSTGQALAAGGDCDNAACRQQTRRVELIYDN